MFDEAGLYQDNWQNGRHVLIMLSGENLRELVLHVGTLSWGVVEIGGGEGKRERPFKFQRANSAS